VGVALELVGLAMRQVQVAVKWSTTGEWRALEIGVMSTGKEGDMGRSGQIGGGGKRGALMSYH
jgi:hypothetical protein